MSDINEGRVFSKTFTGKLIGTHDGVERHFINGAYGREGDLPCVIHPNGKKLWYIENPKRGPFQADSVLHRTTGPAVVTADGDEYWYFLGAIHRPQEDGPAVTLKDGTRKWFENDKLLRTEREPAAAPASLPRP